MAVSPIIFVVLYCFSKGQESPFVAAQFYSERCFLCALQKPVLFTWMFAHAPEIVSCLLKIFLQLTGALREEHIRRSEEQRDGNINSCVIIHKGASFELCYEGGVKTERGQF